MTRPLDFISVTQNPDGGWGYKPVGMSYVEPTSSVLLALRQVAAASNLSNRGQEYLRRTQHDDGGWGIAAVDQESGWMTAWAVRALAGVDDATARRGADWLLRARGLQVSDQAQQQSIRGLLHVDASLTGWPWQVGDAAWVFPTALALLALHPLGFDRHDRVQDGIRFLSDRAISSGGWNVGNPFMVTGDLLATISDTAIVLVALSELGVSDDIVRRSSDWLTRELTKSASSSDLAWGLWAMRQLEIDSAPPAARLQSLQHADGSWMSNPFITSLALLALDSDS